MTTIFIAMKHNDALNLRILLLFLENEEDLNRWNKIEEKYKESFPTIVEFIGAQR